MKVFFEDIFAGFIFRDVVDILIVAFLIYQLLGLIRKTRAEQLLKGVLVFVVATFLSGVFNLHTVHWILKGGLALGAVAVLVVFQPELRRGLEYMGRTKLFSYPFNRMEKETGKRTVSQIVRAVEKFSGEREGALIVIERETALEDIIETGTVVDADLSEQLLRNIFFKSSPLHDGAVIIRNERIYAAGCVLPLSQRQNSIGELGTRHRAGVGMTEHSDAMVIIVSEETGMISMAHDGGLIRFLDIKTVEKTLLDLYVPKGKTYGKKNILQKIADKLKGKKNAEK